MLGRDSYVKHKAMGTMHHILTQQEQGCQGCQGCSRQHLLPYGDRSQKST